ncbi:MAG: hypothetical protein RIK87_15575 [Fuerstiella sp.]
MLPLSVGFHANTINLVSSLYTDIRIDPSLANWSEVLKTCSFDNTRLAEWRRSARSRLVAAAEQFVLRLNGVAEEAELPPLASGLLTGDPDRQPIVMTGHQPVVFHSGLSFKYQTTEEFAVDNGAIALAVVIDTDTGDAGQFSYPELSEDAQVPSRAIDSLASTNNLYVYSRLRKAAELTQVSAKLCDHLRRVSEPEAAKHTEQAMTGYIRLAAARAGAMDANLIMRWQHGIGGRMLELPLSAIASFPEALAQTADILKQPRRFAAAYNSALDVFRDEHGIRNAANPFPNLKIDQDTCELPFWVVSHNRERRHVLEAQTEGNITRLIANGRTVDTFTGNITAESLEPLLLQNVQIVPRGAMITAVLRLLFSDLFVHGTGGGRYDRFTDELIRSWWNVEPPAFTIASASRYLLTRRRQELQRLEEIASSLRDLQFNPQRHFGEDIFPEMLEDSLQVLVQRKEAAVNRLKAAHQAGLSARDIGREIQALTNQIRNAVTTEFEPQLSLLKSLTPEQQDAVHCRTYPWFMFQ